MSRKDGDKAMKRFSIALAFVMAVTALCLNLPVMAASRDPYSGFSATTLDGSNITTYNISSGYLGSTGAGNYFYYENVDFGEVSPTSVELEIGVPEEYSGATVEIRIDSPTGPLLASMVDQPSSFDTALTHKADILTPVTGIHTLYIKTGDKTANFFMIKFNKPLTGQDVYTVFEASDAFMDIKDSEYRYAINILYQLGFLDGFEGDYFYPKMFIKRKDFVEVLFKTLNIEANKKAKQAFLDVTMEQDCYAVINTLAEEGIIEGDGNGYFYPDDFISKDDAMVMICHILGYSEVADMNGGYTDGYKRFATSQNLYDGIGAGEFLRNGETARLMLNMFDADYLELDAVTGDGVKYKEVKGILSKTMDLYSSRGQVTATNNTALNIPESYMDFEHVEIDGVKYEVGTTQAKALLGYECDFYYKLIDDERILAAIMPRNNVKVTTISSLDYDIDEITTELVSYVNSDGTRKKLRFENNSSILYNGVAIDGALDEYIEFLPMRGSVKYIQNPNGKNAVFIDEYINIQIGMVDKEKEIISDKITDTKYELSTAAFYCIKDSEPVDYSRLSVNDIGMLYISKNKTGDKTVRLIIGGTTVNGSIDSKNLDEIVINGVTYKVANEFLTKIEKDFKESYTGTPEEYEQALQSEIALKTSPGTSGIFYINSFNELVLYEVDFSQQDMLGMILSVTPNIEEEEAPSYIKILTSSNEIIRYPTAERIYIDGIRYKETIDIGNAMANLKANVLNMPLRYQIDNKGNVTLIDTELKGAGGQKDTLTKLIASTSYNYGYGTRLLINSSTGKGVIPFASNGLLLSKWEGVMPDQYTFSTGGLSDSGNSGDVYTINPDSETCDIFVWINRGTDYGAKSMVINSIIPMINDDNEFCYNITGIIGSSLEEYQITQDILNGNDTMQVLVHEAGRGDCLRIGTNDKGQITSADLLYIHDGSPQLTYVNEKGETLTVDARVDLNGPVWSDGGQKYRAVCGTAVENTGEYLKIDIGTAGKEDIEYIYTKGTNVVVYNESANTLEDGQTSAAVQKGDRVFVYISDRGTRTVAIYVQD